MCVCTNVGAGAMENSKDGAPAQSSGAPGPLQEAVSVCWCLLRQAIVLPLFFPGRVHAQDVWRNAVSHVVVFILQTFVGVPLMLAGNCLEWFLNFYSLNGGSFFRIFSKLLLEWRLEFPHRESPNYFSVIGFLDPRLDLTDPHSDRFYKFDSKECAELCIMSAKLAYESEHVQKKVVEEKWNMCFHKFYSCNNARTLQKSTQAFIFKDKSRDAKLVVLAFRGTEPFDAYDWATDFDFGWYRPKQHDVGAVHVGFLEALGVQSRTDPKPLEMRARSHVNFAYSVISTDLGDLMLDNPNAQLLITGHSLGGALAVLFAGIMIYLDGTSDKGAQKLLQSLKAIYTFGQPRLGNQKFASYLTKSLEQHGIEYHRVVYGYDFVSRVPFDDTIFRFKHAGHMCNYFNTSYMEKGLREEPDTNFFDVMFFITSRITAVAELCNGLFFNRLFEGDWYKETNLMLIARIVGLFLPGLTGHAPTNYLNAIRMGPENLCTTIKH